METKLLISNLPRDIDASALEDMFTLVGDVRTAHVECDPTTGESKGIGRVEMANAQNALDGIYHFNGQSKRGHVLAVRADKPHVPTEEHVAATKRRLLRRAKARKLSAASTIRKGR